jgi:hypothetical protein
LWPQRTIVFCRYPGRHGNSPAPKDPARTALFDRSFQKWVPGESAPRFQLRSNARFVTDKSDQVARPPAAQHSDQLRQEVGCEGLSLDIQIDVSPHRNACILQFREQREIASDCDLLRHHPLV